MNLHQRQEQAAPVISGRKINNYFTCTVKEVKRLSPQLYEQYGRERTFQTDSFKQILTKRSGGPTNKENISTQNKALRKIKEQTNSKQISQEKKKKSKSNCMLRPQKKSSAVSLTKLFERNRSTNENRKIQTKSVSPSRDIKDYRSGPVEKKNYLSNNYASKTNRQVIPNKSQKSLTDRGRNPLKSVLALNKKPQKFTMKSENVSKTQKKDGSKIKKSKQSSKVGVKKMGNNMEKTQSMAKELDSLLKQTKQKDKKKKKTQSKQKTKKSKQKKVVISHNNSKNFISKNKLNSQFSQDESPEKGILLTRYQNQKPIKRERLSFQPYKKKGKSKQKARTEAFSPEKSLANKNQAATIIQKVFRGYLTRKYIKEFKRTLLAVLKIQKVWRGYKIRKQIQKMKQAAEVLKRENLKLSKLSDISQGSRPAITPRNNQLASLLEEILNQENLNEKIKVKINSFLKKQERLSVSSKNNSVASHLEQEMKSQKRFFQKIDKEKHKFGSPIVRYSPKIQKSDLRKSPEVMIESLLTIQQFQRQKLIVNAKMQIEGLENLTIKNIFSPRTRDNKKLEIHKKLEQDLQKFDQSISEVIKSCKQNEEIVGPIKPFSGNSTPEKVFSDVNLFDKKNRYENSPTMKQEKKEMESIQNMNSSQRKLQDLSMELLQYYQQKTQEKGEKEYDKIDCSYIFIQDYLLSLFQYLRQLGQEYRQGFIDIMRTSRNLEISCFLKNLNVLTEDSDEDISFKLPMYKYLQQQQNQVLVRKVVEEFNNSYKKLQRHQFGVKSNLQDVYLKMILDAVNEALNIERPNSYIFTQASLVGKTNKMRILQLEALEGIDGDDNQPQFSFYFANSMNHIYKWAHFQCGRTIVQQNIEDTPIIEINEISLKQYLKSEALKQQNYYDELLQTIVELSDCIFDQIVLEQGANLYL